MSELPLRVPGADPGVWARTSNAVADAGHAPADRDRCVAAERMLSPQQIADLMGLGYTTIRREIQRGNGEPTVRRCLAITQSMLRLAEPVADEAAVALRRRDGQHLLERRAVAEQSAREQRVRR